MNLIRVGSRNALPEHVSYVSFVIGKMRESGTTNIEDLAHLMMYTNLFYVFASEDGIIPIGMFACSPQQKTCHVLLSFVNHDHRKKGVFKAMLAEVKRSEPNPMYAWNKVTFGVMTTNKTMQQVMRASGAAPEATIYTISTA